MEPVLLAGFLTLLGTCTGAFCWTSAPIGNGSLCMGLLRRKEAPSFSLQSLNCWKTRWNFPKPSAFERERLQTFTHSTGFPALWSSLIYTAGLKWLLDWHLTHSWDSTGSPRRNAQRCIFRQNTLVSFWRSKRWVWEWNLKRRNNLQTHLLPKQKEMAEVVEEPPVRLPFILRTQRPWCDKQETNFWHNSNEGNYLFDQYAMSWIFPLK